MITVLCDWCGQSMAPNKEARTQIGHDVFDFHPQCIDALKGAIHEHRNAQRPYRMNAPHKAEVLP